MLYIPLAILSAFGMFWGTQAPRGSVPDSVGALEVGLGAVSGLAVDGQGNVYLASRSLNRILRLDPYGRLAIVAGSERSAFALLRNVEVHGGPPPGDKGPAMAAQLDQPIGLALDWFFIGQDSMTEKMRRFGLRTGDVVLALDGFRVRDDDQYLCVRGFSDEPEMQAIVWRDGRYLEVKGQFKRRRFGPAPGRM